MKDSICQWLNESLSVLRRHGLILPDIHPQVSAAKRTAHGDYTTNVALILAPQLSLPAPELARKIIGALPESEYLHKAEVAGAGFINFYLKAEAKSAIIDDIISVGSGYGHVHPQVPQRVLLEYVSANPTGPLHVGHGRGAAYGETLAAMLQAAGYQVEREYYVNDAGRQIDILVLSTWLRYLELSGVELNFPTHAYQGAYIWDVAAEIRNQHGDSFEYPAKQVFSDLEQCWEHENGPAHESEQYLSALIANCRAALEQRDYAVIRETVLETMLNSVKSDLERFGVHYDNWFSEQSLFDNGDVHKAIDILEKNNCVYEKDGALWFRATDFGDDKDRVLRRSNNDFTYFASDIAYHLNKYQRGYDLIINVWGADHHGYVTRLKTAMRALGLAAEKLVIILVQFANLYRGEEKVSMSTRGGEFITLKSLCDEVGVDAARFFYIMRNPKQHLDFDIELAKTNNVNNPVFYVQYAHARISNVFKQMKERKLTFAYDPSVPKCLDEPEEQALVKLLYDYHTVVHDAADTFDPQQLLNFVRDIATHFHSYYNRCQFLVADAQLRHSRLSLLTAVQLVLKDGLRFFGVSAPDRM